MIIITVLSLSLKLNNIYLPIKQIGDVGVISINVHCIMIIKINSLEKIYFLKLGLHNILLNNILKCFSQHWKWKDIHPSSSTINRGNFALANATGWQSDY